MSGPITVVRVAQAPSSSWAITRLGNKLANLVNHSKAAFVAAVCSYLLDEVRDISHIHGRGDGVTDFFPRADDRVGEYRYTIRSWA